MTISKMTAVKGYIDLNIVKRGTSAAAPFTAYTTTPKGGVRAPVAITIAIKTPKWIESMPKPVTTGCRIGVIISSMDMASRKQPIIKIAIAIISNVRLGDCVIPLINHAMILGTPAITRNLLNIMHPIRRKATIDMVIPD